MRRLHVPEKLILYHGWNDPAISPLNSVNYYESVLKAMGPQKAESFIRLYMVPGMGHCFSGPGPNSFGQSGHTTARGPEYGVFVALEQWVETGTTPAQILATKYVGDDVAKGVKLTRPLCPYPQIANLKVLATQTRPKTSFVLLNASNGLALGLSLGPIVGISESGLATLVPRCRLPSCDVDRAPQRVTRVH